jgi:hypothetical protein
MVDGSNPESRRYIAIDSRVDITTNDPGRY